MRRLEGRVAVVTGAASGIGDGIARRLAFEGARVIVADLNETAGRAVASGIDGRFVRCDVTREEDLEAAVDAATGTFGRLDIMVNNAGIPGNRMPIQDVTVEEFHRVVDILLLGVVLGTKHAVRAMRAGGRGGSIVSIASTAALLGGIGPDIYTACKGAVLALTRVVAAEQAEVGIRANAVCPGAIVTDMLANVLGVEEAGERDRIRAELAERLRSAQPLAGPGMPDDIAGAVAWLASDDARFVTGQAIAVDGGQSSSHNRPESARNPPRD